MKLSRGWAAFVVVAVLVGVLVLYLASRYPDVLTSQDGQVDLTRSLLWLGLIGASLFVHRKLPLGNALRYGAIWVAIGAALVLAYSFRYEAKNIAARITGELLPHTAQVIDGSVEVRAGGRGHFVLEIEVDGVDIRFLVDTGASDVVLSPFDAARLGFKTDELSFSKIYNTANGTVRGAPVRLGRMAVGPIVLRDMPASVNGADMDRSLLGMRFLNRLSGYEVRDGKLILRP